MIEFSAEEVAAGKHETLDPERYDLVWDEDHMTCKAIPLLWWDNASYAAWQSAQ